MFNLGLKEKMAKIKLEGVEYDTKKLSDNGKAQLASLQFLDAQMSKLKSEIAVFQTAKAAYVLALKEELENDNNSDDKN